MKFTRTHKANRGTSTYKSTEGLTLYVPKSAGDQPESFTADGLNVPAPSTSGARARMTPEERKAKAAERRAANAGLTPAQRLAQEEDRLAKRAAVIAARKAKLQGAAPPVAAQQPVM